MRACRAYKGVYKVYRNPRRTTLRNQYEIRRNPWENHRNIGNPYERNSFRKHLFVDTNKTNHGGKGCQLRKEISLNLASETASEGFRKTAYIFGISRPALAPMASHGFPMLSYGFPMVPHDLLMVPHGFPMILYGCCMGSFHIAFLR